MKLPQQQNLMQFSGFSDIITPKTETKIGPWNVGAVEPTGMVAAQEDFIKCIPHLFKFMPHLSKLFFWARIINDDVSTTDYTVLNSRVISE